MSNSSTFPRLATSIPVDTTTDLPAPAVSAPRRTRRALVAFPLLAAVGIGIGSSVYLLGRGHESTNDAQVEGHVASVAARVTGQVEQVLVNDNQQVAAGDVLVVLDDRDLAAKVAAARADLAAMSAQLRAAQTSASVTRASADSNLAIARGGLKQAAAVEGTTRATIARSEADLSAAESKRNLALLELDRTQKLVESGALSQAELDVKRSAFEQADANREQARAALASARVAQAQAALDQAELNLSYTRVRAGVAGVVSRRSVEVGQLASPDRPMMALVPLDDTWVVANFKEDQIADMQPGQSARVHIDTFDHELSGHVDSLAGGTGSRFSLLPPDNASGNFTKVVQRVPVLIKLDPHPDFVLRPGMSATADVVTQ